MSAVDKNAEILLVNTTNNSGTITLPLTTTLPYRVLTIKHIGSTSLNGITLATQGSDLFETGLTTYGIQQFTTFVSLYANASANRWLLVGGTNTFTQLISSLTVNTINGQNYIPMSPTDLVSTSLLTSSLRSTVTGLGSSGYLSSASNLISSPFLDETVQSTLRGLGSAGYLSSASLQSSMLGLNTSFITSSLTVSSISFGNDFGFLTLGDVQTDTLSSLRIFTSTVQVDGQIGLFDKQLTTYGAITLSNGSLFINNIAVGGSGGSSGGDVTSTNLTSTTLGLGTLGYLSSPQLVSTVRGLGSAGYISSFPRFLSTNAFFTSSLVASTLSVTNTFFTNSLVASNVILNALTARSTNLSSVFISSLTATTGYISSFITDSLTIGDGNGFIDFGAARAVVFSSIQTNTGSLFATTVFVGGNSNLNQIRYWGNQGIYNNTILAEVSTGSALGAQEFLLFKGSSASDRIRFQTTGDIRFEPQVAAREFSTATALATPTMILQSNLVGINIAQPLATLDVGGTVRAINVSSQQLFVSSVNGQAFQTFVSTSVLNTSLVSTVRGLGSAGYLSTAVIQLIAGSNITISPLNGEGIVTINAASGGGGGGITTENLESTVTGLGSANYISGPFIEATSIVASQYMASLELIGNDTSASTFKMYDFAETSYGEFPVWNSSNQIAGSDPEPSPLRLDVFGSARILKNLYIGSTTTILTTAGMETAQILTSTMTLSDKGPLFASTNTVTSITDVFLNDYYVGQRVPVLPIIISSLTENMVLHPEFLGMHFLLQNSDFNFTRLLVRADATFVSNVPDGWYCYLKQFPDSNFFNDGVGAETDLGDVPLPDAGSGYGGSNYAAPMKFVVSGGFKIPY